MKYIFKFGIMFFLIYFGTKGIMDVARTEIPSTKLYIDLFIYIMFVGFPAMSYWGQSIENAFKEEPENNDQTHDDNIDIN